LKDGVDGNENGAVLVIATGKPIPDKNLDEMLVTVVPTLKFRVMPPTIAMHLPSPTRIKPIRSSLLSGRKAHARPSWFEVSDWL
jgi:hypothetical protein